MSSSYQTAYVQLKLGTKLTRAARLDVEPHRDGNIDIDALIKSAKKEYDDDLKGVSVMNIYAYAPGTYSSGNLSNHLPGNSKIPPSRTEAAIVLEVRPADGESSGAAYIHLIRRCSVR